MYKRGKSRRPACLDPDCRGDYLPWYWSDSSSPPVDCLIIMCEMFFSRGNKTEHVSSLGEAAAIARVILPPPRGNWPNDAPAISSLHLL